MKNKLIIFDCFGVIFEEIAPPFFNNHFEKEEAAILKEKFFVPADLGEVTVDELFTSMANELNMDKSQIEKEWQELIRLKPEMPPIIKRLKENADIALLSNAPLGFVENLFEEYNLTGLFDRMFISCNLKMAKPDLEIYKYVLSEFKNNYDGIYMIDDNWGNLEQLHKIGITPIHFRSAEKMLEELKG